MNNPNFKLLAIRPLEGCSERFKKVLEGDRIYQFYQDYQFIDSEQEVIKTNGDVHTIKYNPTVPENLYKVDDIQLNISAIVGKNGSGKSTLIELLFLSVYLLAVDEQILARHDQLTESNYTGIDIQVQNRQSRLKELIRELTPLEREIENIDKRLNFRFNALERPILEYAGIKNSIDWNKKEIKKLENLKLQIQEIREGLSIEIFFEIDGVIYLLRQIGEKSALYDFKQKKSNSWHKPTLLEKNKGKYDLSSQFFYSIVLNYSHYALNELEVGPWIKELFHKNDGYQTPIVINPMRDEGIIDINNENNLVRARLLANILAPETEENSPRALMKDKKAHWLHIELDKKKMHVNDAKQHLQYRKKYAKELKLIIKTFIPENQNRKKTYWDKYAEEYLLKKLIDISDKYPPFKVYFSNGQFTLFEKYLTAVQEDDSHITFKFWQTIYFLKYDYAKLYIHLTEDKLTGHPINLETLSDELDEWKKSDIDEDKKKALIHFIPPPFVKTDILFDEEAPRLENKQYKNSLSQLSSGEKQKIFATSSIIYHLRFLNSVHGERDGIEHKYQNINLVFDEIELYYHPELQRTFIADFRRAIRQSGINYIKKINCVFITHSPFILSDIPSRNVMYLGKDHDPNLSTQSFGSNIHDLLANDFYLEESFMGEFARNKIEETIILLNLFKERIKYIEFNKKELEQPENKKQVIKKEHSNQIIHHYIELLSILKPEIESTFNIAEFLARAKEPKMDLEQYEILKTINLIGEPVLHKKLSAMYDDIVKYAEDNP